MTKYFRRFNKAYQLQRSLRPQKNSRTDEPELAVVPEVVASSRQDDPVRREALSLHNEGDVAVLLSQHQHSELLRQQVDVVDLRHGGQRPQRMTVAHGLRFPQTHLTHRADMQTNPVTET